MSKEAIIQEQKELADSQFLTAQSIPKTVDTQNSGSSSSIRVSETPATDIRKADAITDKLPPAAQVLAISQQEKEIEDMANNTSIADVNRRGKNLRNIRLSNNVWHLTT